MSTVQRLLSSCCGGAPCSRSRMRMRRCRQYRCSRWRRIDWSRLIQDGMQPHLPPLCVCYRYAALRDATRPSAFLLLQATLGASLRGCSE
jgi:hypothetical protein